ncbi:Uroporphyrinogen decarboxylase [Labeo rohita]|uniref:Uroporphyrinogen decarboxylase n=1 Tax=Labeo rohita TaxID=84645 RepID=A0ABQ8MW14_LABRO|nr:Uroporphyrinogen decarboxylase [Labeo rohita]
MYILQWTWQERDSLICIKGSLASYLILVEKFTTVLQTRGISILSTFAEANEIYQLLPSEPGTL